MTASLPIDLRKRPELDPDFVPAVAWNHAYRTRAAADPASSPLRLALARPDGTVFVDDTVVLPHDEGHRALNERFVERRVKFLLWQHGGSRLFIGADAGVADALAAYLGSAYSPGGARAFDDEMVGRKVFGEPLTVTACALDEVPAPHQHALALGRHLDGCRIGFDLGGSDRKCAALIDGQVVHSEEVAWDPYFQADPSYHQDGIDDTLRRAARHLPRVDAIGGSAAGVYVGNEVRLSSLFRGVLAGDFEARVRRIFFRLQEAWDNVPFEVVNDGEVTALAGSMALGASALLGVSMGTSQAAGYCDADGHITQGLDELAFAPIDYRDDAPLDEWSQDRGCGVQYFSQQGVARLATLAGIELPDDMPLAERLVAVQELMAHGDARARQVYATIGTCFGYAIAHYADFYPLDHVLAVGRVTSGPGGELIVEQAEQLLATESPDLAERIALHTLGEQDRRHGQAIAAASLPRIR